MIEKIVSFFKKNAQSYILGTSKKVAQCQAPFSKNGALQQSVEEDCVSEWKIIIVGFNFFSLQSIL